MSHSHYKVLNYRLFKHKILYQKKIKIQSASKTLLNNLINNKILKSLKI